MLVDRYIDSQVGKRELRIDDYPLPFLVLHNSLRGSHSLSSSAYIVSINDTGNGNPLNINHNQHRFRPSEWDWTWWRAYPSLEPPQKKYVFFYIF